MKKLFYTTGVCIALTLAACSSNRSEESGSATADIRAAGTDTASAVPGIQPKLVKTADLDFKVKDVRRSCSSIQRKATGFGGLVMHSDIQAQQVDSKTIPVSDDSLQLISSYRVEAQMTVRVPSENLAGFVQSVASDATVIYSSRLNMDDRSIDYLGNTLKRQGRKKILDKALLNDTLKAGQLLRLADAQDGIIDNKMANLKTDAEVRYSTVGLHFVQHPLVTRENVANNDLGTFQPPLLKRFVQAAASGFDFFIRLAIALVQIWPLFVLGLGGWLAFPHLQRIRKVRV